MRTLEAQSGQLSKLEEIDTGTYIHTLFCLIRFSWNYNTYLLLILDAKLFSLYCTCAVQ